MEPKKRRIISYSITIVIIAILGSCFSPWRGNGGSATLTINLGPLPRAIIEQGEIAGFTHEIVLTGPGETITRTVNVPGSIVINLEPGIWTVAIKARGAVSNSYDITAFPLDHPYLRAMGWGIVDVIEGKRNTVRINMIPAVEISNIEQLVAVINAIDDLSEIEKIIVISNDMNLQNTDGISIKPGQTIIITAEENVIIKTDIFPINVNGGTLILGHKESQGTITIDGGGNVLKPVININSGTLELNDGIIITNGGNRAVRVNNTGIFNMYGGEISGNSVSGSDSDGGGVEVASGLFNMYGGSIHDNTAERFGGGVFVNVRHGDAVFVKTGGTIAGTGHNLINNAHGTTAPAGDQIKQPPGNAAAVMVTFFPGGGTTPYSDFWTRNITSGPDDNLDSRESGAAGGWQ